MPTGPLPFPTTPNEALHWLAHGGNPNAPATVSHVTARRDARNPWWVEAFWRLQQESGSLSDDCEAWARVVVDALQRGADPNVVDAEHQAPLPYLFGFGFAYDAMVWDAWLQRPGAAINALNPEGQGVLFTLLTDRQYRGTMPVIALLDQLTAHGLDVNTIDKTGENALHWLTGTSVTARPMATTIAAWLGEHGLDGERLDRSGWSGRERLSQAGMTDVLMAYENGRSRWERDRLRQAIEEETTKDVLRPTRRL